MNSIIGLVVEFIVAIDEARVRFTDDALEFPFCFFVFGSRPPKHIPGPISDNGIASCLVQASSRKIMELYGSLSKAYISMIIQIRTHRISLAHFLYKSKI